MGNLEPASLEGIVSSLQQPGLSQSQIWVAAFYQAPGSVFCASWLLEDAPWLLLGITATLKYRVLEAPRPIVFSICMFGALQCIKLLLLILRKNSCSPHTISPCSLRQASAVLPRKWEEAWETHWVPNSSRPKIRFQAPNSRSRALPGTQSVSLSWEAICTPTH